METKQAEALLKGKTVIYVEDNNKHRSQYGFLLRRIPGITVIDVPDNGQGLQEKLRIHKDAIVLSDIERPNEVPEGLLWARVNRGKFPSYLVRRSVIEAMH